MRYRWIGLLALVCGLGSSLSSSAHADDTKSNTATHKRTDPRGITGISPFMESVIKGNKAYLARDFEGAISSYQEAIKKAPNQPLGHLLLGQAYVANDKLEDANGAYQTAHRYADKDPVIRGKALFVMADLRERQQRWDDALTAWKTYADFIAATPKAKGFPNTPASRIKAIEKRKELENQYSKVKERIAQREQDAAKGK